MDKMTQSMCKRVVTSNKLIIQFHKYNHVPNVVPTLYMQCFFVEKHDKTEHNECQANTTSNEQQHTTFFHCGLIYLTEKVTKYPLTTSIGFNRENCSYVLLIEWSGAFGCMLTQCQEGTT